MDSATQISAVVASGTGASGHIVVTNSAGPATSTDTFTFAAAVPSNTASPHISGTQNFNGFALAFVGNHLSVNTGSWTQSPTSFAYQWLQCDSTYSNCTNIPGATSNAYTLASSDRGHTVRVVVTAHNAAGDSSPSASPNNDLRGNVGAPEPTADDAAITGTPQVGTPLLAEHGTWGGDTPITFSYQWFLCGTSAPSGPGDCAPISGATGTTYTPSAGDAGHFLALKVSGSNSSGSNGFSLFETTRAAVIGQPSITSFSPTSGGVGSSVTITGTNFTGANGVKFNATSATTFHVDSGTQITATVPTGATTGKITVSSPGGNIVSSDTFTVLASATITSFLPASGVANVTPNIVINGTNLLGATDVSFNGTHVAAGHFSATATKITVDKVPAGATTGKISVTTPAGTAQSASNFFVYQQPVIQSFTPSLQAVGGTVTLLGSNFTGAVGPGAVKLDNTNALFAVNSDGQITATVPTIALGPHTWHVTNPAGTGDSTGTFTVGTVSPPTITSFAPTHGPANSEFTTVVTIHGTNFAGVSSVMFGGSKLGTGIAIDTSNPSDNTITVTAPVGALTGQITVTNPKGSPKTATPFVVDAPPTVVSFSPTSGRPNVTPVTITGGNFVTSANGGHLFFGGTEQTAFSVNPLGTQVTATVPNGATTGPITFTHTNIGHSTTAASFVVVSTPTITSFTPEVGKAGTTITITGNHFLGGNPPTVKFLINGGPTTALGTAIKVVDDHTITVGAPAEPVGTTANLVVHNDSGDSDQSSDTFLWGATPVITSFSPTHGPANAQRSTSVDITGTDFTGATSVLFGAKPAALINVISPTEIMAVAPAGALSGQLTVVTPAAMGKSTGTFTVDPLPTISKFTPAPPLGADPGTTVVITGTNFDLGANGHVDGVSVNGTALTAGNGTTAGTFHVDSATQITAKLPNSGVSTGPLVVMNSPVGSVSTAPVSLIVKRGPSISSFSPLSGIVGTKMTITGSGFSGGGLSITFNGNNAPASAKIVVPTVVSDTQATVAVPTGATTGTLTASNSQGSSDPSSDTFVVAIKPTISSFDPTSGPASAQATTVVDIQGTHLDGTTSVIFNKTASPFISVNDDGDITAVVPAGAGTGKITIVNPAGAVSSTGLFTADGVPTITSISPKQAAVGATVTINGSNLVGEMDGTQFPGGTFVDFHGFFGATVESITSNQVVVDVPNGATTGPLLLSDEWGQTAVSPLFTIVNPPLIDSFFNEFTGLSSGKRGQPVVIFGSGFTGTTSVTINGTPVPAGGFTVVADWEIIATVPKAAANGAGPITITNAGGTDSSAPDNFTVLP